MSVISKTLHSCGPKQELLAATEWRSNPLEAFGGSALEGGPGAQLPAPV